MARIRIGSRGSDLALVQSRQIADLLRSADPALEVEIIVIRTTGDKILDAPLAKIGGKGLFTKEIEEALLAGAVDLAVHSLKDLPTDLPDGLALGAVLSRRDPSDALVSPQGMRFADLPRGARIGTSSLRRQAQLLHRRPDLAIVTIRGNVATRIERGERDRLDAVILARAGLERLGLADRITEILPPDLILPAPGQGALGIEIRDDDGSMAERLRALEDGEARAATDAERGFLRALGGGCQVPIGALARPAADGSGRLHLTGVVGSPDGTRLLRGAREGDARDAAQIGSALAGDLIERGAGRILEDVAGATPPGGEA